MILFALSTATSMVGKGRFEKAAEEILSKAKFLYQPPEHDTVAEIYPKNKKEER